MRFSEQYIFIPVFEALDTQAGIDGQSINMGLLHNVCFPLNFGAVTGDAVLKFYVGATDGTKTTAVAFDYRLSTGVYKAASADLYGAVTAVASAALTLTAATITTKTILIEFDSEAIAAATPWLTAELSAAATVLLTACVAIGRPRYQSNTGTSAV